MYKLNLPPFDYKLKKAEGKVWIFDVIRKKFIVLTPEEWVRQHFLHYVINDLRYPKSLIKVESGLIYNQLSRRSDILIYDHEANPWMIIECKSPTLKLSEKAVLQASAYNASLRAKYLTISNGLLHYCAATDWAMGTTTLLSELPSFK